MLNPVEEYSILRLLLLVASADTSAFSLVAHSTLTAVVAQRTAAPKEKNKLNRRILKKRRKTRLPASAAQNQKIPPLPAPPALPAKKVSSPATRSAALSPPPLLCPPKSSAVCWAASPTTTTKASAFAASDANPGNQYSGAAGVFQRECARRSPARFDGITSTSDGNHLIIFLQE